MSSSILRNLFAAGFAIILTAAGFAGCDSKTDNAAERKVGEANTAKTETELDKGLAAAKQKDDRTAFGHFKTAAEQGDAEAQYRLSRCYSEGKGVDIDEGKAFEWAMKAAESGDAKAQCVVGLAYLKGSGIPEDIGEGKNWGRKAINGLLKAAEQSDAEAMMLLASCYADGLGVKKDEEEGFRWLKKAAEQNYALAQTAVGLKYLMIEKNGKEAEKWLRKAAEQDEVSAQLFLGMICLGGVEGKSDGIGESTAQPDWNEAEKWLGKAADSNVERYAAQAKKLLKRMEESGKQNRQRSDSEKDSGFDEKSELGKGLTASRQKDYKAAFGHFKTAAEQGDTEAQYRLADSYAKSKGVERDLEKAFGWMKKAAEQGCAKAQMCLGFYYEGGIGVRKDPAEAEKWMKRSFNAVHRLAEQGDAEAQLYLATYYGSNIGAGGGEKDGEMALLWNRKAAENGNEQAQKNVGLLYLSKEQNTKEAVKWLRLAAENGEQEAPMILGLIYWGGDTYIFGRIAESTFAPDWNEAEKWFRTALNGPFAEEAKNALVNIAEARKQGKGPTQEER